MPSPEYHQKLARLESEFCTRPPDGEWLCGKAVSLKAITYAFPKKSGITNQVIVMKGDSSKAFNSIVFLPKGARFEQVTQEEALVLGANEIEAAVLGGLWIDRFKYLSGRELRAAIQAAALVPDPTLYPTRPSFLIYMQEAFSDSTGS